MQYAPGFIAPISSSSVSSTSSAAGMTSSASVSGSSSPTTLSAVNNIMTALVGNTVPTSAVATPSQVISTTMSGALGNSIGSLLKSADNKLDMSEEEWAQEVLEHQESTELQNQEFAQRMRKDLGSLGQSGFAIPGFDDPEMHNLIQGE